MNRCAAARIASDIKKEFADLRADLGYHLGPEVTVSHARRLLPEHAPKMVLARARLLRDTLLNYLMEDAMAALEKAPTKVKNAFYDSEPRKHITSTFSFAPSELRLSSDLCTLAAGVAADAVTSIKKRLVASSSCSGVVAGITEYPRKRLKEDLDDYLARSEQAVSEWLAEVEKAFVAHFERFCREQGVPDYERAGSP
ncbi:MAG: hypothetical protein NZ578_05975 [Candidatus Binatia bacterium]|nr:hypothetical protein [Candidatus Binatia bacterium]